jgi:hypothetical protein
MIATWLSIKPNDSAVMTRAGRRTGGAISEVIPQPGACVTMSTALEMNVESHR